MPVKKDDISPEIYERIAAVLLAGEELLWVGLPGDRISKLLGGTHMSRTISILLLALYVGGSIMLLLLAGPRAPSPVALLALLVGLGLLITFIWWLNRINSGTTYAVTNRRAIILHPGGRVQSYGPQAIRGIERVERADGSGNLIFNPGEEALMEQGAGFLSIDNVREVEALLLKTFYTPPGDGAQDDNFRPPPPRRR